MIRLQVGDLSSVLNRLRYTKHSLQRFAIACPGCKSDEYWSKRLFDLNAQLQTAVVSTLRRCPHHGVTRAFFSPPEDLLAV